MKEINFMKKKKSIYKKKCVMKDKEKVRLREKVNTPRLDLSFQFFKKLEGKFRRLRWHVTRKVL